MRLKGDETVNHMLDSRLERESTWKKKFPTIVAVNSIFSDNIKHKKISIPEDDIGNHKKKTIIHEAKKAIKKSIHEETLLLWNSTIEK